MATLRDITANALITVYSCPIHDGTMWNCGNTRFYDPQKTLYEVPTDVIVPEIITIKQAKLILERCGLLEATELLISKQPKYVQIIWDYASEFHRDNPLLLEIAAELNLSSQQLDSMFIDASTL